jgi:hypothetical protein
VSERKSNALLDAGAAAAGAALIAGPGALLIGGAARIGGAAAWIGGAAAWIGGAAAWIGAGGLSGASDTPQSISSHPPLAIGFLGVLGSTGPAGGTAADPGPSMPLNASNSCACDIGTAGAITGGAYDGAGTGVTSATGAGSTGSAGGFAAAAMEDFAAAAAADDDVDGSAPPVEARSSAPMLDQSSFRPTAAGGAAAAAPRDAPGPNAARTSGDAEGLEIGYIKGTNQFFFFFFFFVRKNKQ